jgi:hypothetical protein
MTTETQQYPVDVEGIGTFFFAKRTMRHEFKIQAEYSRLTEGVETPTANLEIMAGIFSTLRVLTMRAPDGWDLDSLDPLDERDYARAIRVHAALREKEGSFRRKQADPGAGAGQGDGRVSGVPVPAPLPAASN